MSARVPHEAQGATRGASAQARRSAQTVYLEDDVLHADKFLAACHLLELLGRERERARQHGRHLRQQIRSAARGERRAASGARRGQGEGGQRENGTHLDVRIPRHQICTDI